MFKNLEKEQKGKFKGNKVAARRKNKNKTQFSSVQSLSRVQLFATP